MNSQALVRQAGSPNPCVARCLQKSGHRRQRPRCPCTAFAEQDYGSVLQNDPYGGPSTSGGAAWQPGGLDAPVAAPPPPKLIIRGMEFTFSTARSYIGTRLHNYPVGEPIHPDDQQMLLEVLQFHPSAAEKIGCGVSHMVVNETIHGTKCFWIYRTDRTFTDFSYVKCLQMMNYMCMQGLVTILGKPVGPVPSFEEMLHLYPVPKPQSSQDEAGRARAAARERNRQQPSTDGQWSGSPLAALAAPVPPAWTREATVVQDLAPRDGSVDDGDWFAAVDACVPDVSVEEPPPPQQQQQDQPWWQQWAEEEEEQTEPQQQQQQWPPQQQQQQQQQLAAAQLQLQQPQQQQEQWQWPPQPVQPVQQQEQPRARRLPAASPQASSTAPSARVALSNGNGINRRSRVPRLDEEAPLEVQRQDIPWQDCLLALRNAVKPQLRQYKHSVLSSAAGQRQELLCALTGVVLTPQNSVVRYAPPQTLKDVAVAWMRAAGIKDRSQLEVGYVEGMMGPVMLNTQQAVSWQGFHGVEANVQLVAKSDQGRARQRTLEEGVAETRQF